MKSIQSLSALLGLLLLLAPATLLAKKSAMSPHNITRIQQVMDAVISPDGHSIAYVKWVQSEPFKDADGSGWRELHVIRKDGKSRSYVQGDVKVRGIQWTPDGQGISFLTKRGSDKQNNLYVISLSGGEAERVLTHSSGISSYQWHPSGKKVAFLARSSTSKAKKALAKKGFKAEIYEEELHNSQIWIADIAKDADSPRKLALPGSVSAVHWSPNGKRLACAVAPTALIDDHYMKRRIVVLDAKSGKIKGRINNPGKLGSIYWRPDGKQIAFLAGGDLNDPSAQRLMIADAAGGPMQDLMPELKDGGVRGAAWLNNENMLCLVDHGVETNITLLGLKGDASVLINDGSGALSHLSVDRKSGNFSVLSHTAAHAQELFSGNATKGKLTRLTDSNPWLAD
ncbi:MAG TPA: hypothetical protein EYN66_22260, partial [Myxococcales bacterium]|nr:hypothetical protein [Myxococcales bacterium]